ncbi:MAG TPA: prolipoprotein diacylglyceryl transferase family protein [Candidatus Sulfotelmatobacter sp.]|nr:prolipoprotein diacylglyceryl transferase family protein [Candidatus Sulfotelmatobacter sp.]
MYLNLGSRSIHPHLFFESLAYVVAFATYLHLRRRFGDPLATPLRWAAVAAAMAGAALGSKILFWLEDPRVTLQNLHNPAYLAGGKTIVGALIGGLLTVELVKRYIGLRASTGDLYAIPLAIGIAIGRIGCFLTGLSDNTYGTPTTLPWGVNFGDGIPRHPTQLYEITFLIALIPFLHRVMQLNSESPVMLNEARTKQSEVTAKSEDPFPPPPNRRAETLRTTNGERSTAPFLPGDAFKFFIVAYASFRLLADFVKPYPHLFLGLGGIPWACVLILFYYSPDFVRRLRVPAFSPVARKEPGK